jgi:hypothetical protein
MPKLRDIVSKLFSTGERQEKVVTPIGPIEYDYYKARYNHCIREIKIKGRVIKYNEFCEVIEVIPPVEVKNTLRNDTIV